MKDLEADPEFEPDYRHVAAAMCLSCGFSIKEAAASAGVSEVTISRWKNQPGFQELLKEKKQKAFLQIDAREREVLSLDWELRRRRKRLATDLMALLEEKVKLLTPEDIPTKAIPSFAKAVIDLEDDTEDDLCKALKLVQGYGYTVNHAKN